MDRFARVSHGTNLLVEHPVGGSPTLGRQAQVAALLQLEQERARGHVFERSVGSAPFLQPTQLHREPIPAPLRMALQQMPQLLQLGGTEDAALKDQCAIHSPTVDHLGFRVQPGMKILSLALLLPKPACRHQLRKRT
jgi:hypothetical protein